LVNAEFTLTIDPEYRIVRLEGVTKLIDKLAADDPGRKPLLRQLIAEAALKQEFTDLLDLVPNESEGVGRGATWPRRSVLDRGVLGTWDATRRFTYRGKEGQWDKITVTTSQMHTAAKPSEAPDLGFKVIKSDLKSQSGSGVVLFDRTAGRLVSAEEVFSVEGSLLLEVAGQETKVALSQRQRTTLRVTKTNPVE
jgi:hypothetical protein